MANFGDFNFGDDNPTVDTDPTPDPPNPSSVDGIQNDVTNYDEPGEGDEVKDQDPTVWDTRGNPEEPTAQEDDIPPVSSVQDAFNDYQLRKKFDKREYARVRKNVNNNFRDWLFDFDVKSDGEEAAIENEDNFQYRKFMSPKVRKNASRNLRRFIKDFDIKYDSLIDEDFEDEEEESEISPDLQSLVDELKQTYGSEKTIMQFLEGDVGIIDLIEQFTNNEDYDDLDDIPGMDDFAESVFNASGIGEMFDRVVIAGFDVDNNDDMGLSIDSLLSGNVIANATFIDGIDNDEFLQFNLGSDDLNDYLTDLVIGSDILEFQNMGDAALENFDGLL